MLYAVIMAGGSGTRFWPASRRLHPKQLLALSGQRTMIQATSDRLSDVITADRQWVLTNRDLIAAVAEQLPALRSDHLIGEPAKRDTAPCIGLAAAMIHQQDPDAVMAVMPSDHVIETPEQFAAALVAAESLVNEDPERIVTFGVKPTYAAESFGYIQRGEAVACDDLNAFAVAQFKEKPNQATAAEYLRSGQYYWNSGIFVWKAATILKALRENQPAMYAHLEKIADSLGSDDFDETLEREFTAIEGTSIDYAVMETYPNVVVIEASFRWDDVGSWQALGRLHPKDQDGNTVVGNHVGIDTSGSIIFGQPNHTIVTIGVEDLIVVQTPDATLVAPKSAEERVREAVKQLQDAGRDECL